MCVEEGVEDPVEGGVDVGQGVDEVHQVHEIVPFGQIVEQVGEDAQPVGSPTEEVKTDHSKRVERYSPH